MVNTDQRNQNWWQSLQKDLRFHITYIRNYLQWRELPFFLNKSKVKFKVKLNFNLKPFVEKSVKFLPNLGKMFSWLLTDQI